MGLQFLLQMGFCFFFFSFTLSFLILSFFLFISRLKPWCNCNTCKTYLNSSWKSQFHNLSDWYTHLLLKNPTSTIHVHILGNIITANPKNVEHVLKTNFNNYPKGKPFSSILGDLLGRGIFNVDGDIWRFQRKMASLQLGSVSVRSYAFDIVTKEINTRLIPLLVSYFSEDDEVSSSSFSKEKEVERESLDLQDVFRRFSFDTICKFSFGLDPGCLHLSLPISEFAAAFDVASRLSAQRAMSASPYIWKIKKFLNIGVEKELKKSIKLVDSLAESVIKHKRNKMEAATADDDLLSRFMSSSSPADDDKYLRDIVVSFLLAGRDTVASSLTCYFWLLQQNPHVIEKIRKESDRVMNTTSYEFLATYGEIQKMSYLQASIYESLRLYPPVQFDSKFCQEDDVFPDGTFVKKGTRVTYHPYAMGRMKNIWGEDCNEFKPERWLRDDDDGDGGGVFKPANPFSYPVFQAGQRVCLGKDMALVEMKSIALALIRRFDFEIVLPAGKNCRKSPKFVPGLTATVEGGLPVIFRERKI